MKNDTSDLLYGVSAISAYLTVSDRQCRDLIERKGVPVFRLDGKVCGSRTAIDAWIATKASAAMQSQTTQAA